MGIFDTCYRGCVELWSRDGGLSRTSVAYPPSFYMHLKDPHAHWEMIEGLESRYRVEEFNFNTIFGTFQGHRIYASDKVAEKIEKQTRYAAELYNVDVRQDQRYLASDIVTGGATVISVIAAGRRSAADIDAWVRSQRLSKKDMNRYQRI